MSQAMEWTSGKGGFSELDGGKVGHPYQGPKPGDAPTVTPRHRLNCTVRPVRLGETSIEFSVDGYQDGVLCFKGRFINVIIVADKFVKQKVPADIRAFVEPYLSPAPAGQ